MDTLYDLLGALPHDDADGLRTAFRRAVKSTHPDLRPGDPDAAVKFRQIVRANDILCDKDQRAAYDHLLMLAHAEKDPAAAHPIAAKIHKIASGVLAFASLSIVSAGGYLLFMHMSVAVVAPPGGLWASHTNANPIDLTSRLSASIAALSPADTPDPAAVNAFIAARSEFTSAANAMAMAPAAMESESTSAIAAADPADHATSSNVAVAGNGETGAGVVDLDPVSLDSRFTAPYVDRGILFFHDKKDEHAFPDLAPLKRSEKSGRPKSLADAAKAHQDGMPKSVPLPQPRIVPRYMTPQQPWYATAATTAFSETQR